MQWKVMLIFGLVAGECIDNLFLTYPNRNIPEMPKVRANLLIKKAVDFILARLEI